tara:strand:+ start:226 stop:1008 length:783 start_codon:yes stop_codon:yes gene_type:complete
MKVLSWNVNSIRVRKDQLFSVVKKENPDFICLQETKTVDNHFPREILEKKGYFVYVNGIQSYNGVAIISKIEANKISSRKFCNQNDARHIQADFKNFSIHSLYVPAGGDIPDVNNNEKFGHKLKFLDEMANFFNFDKNRINIVCGDLNVSPNEDDVWSHRQLQNVVSHTKVEREKLIKIMNKGKFIDTTRMFISPPENVFTWWSYRSKDFKKNNRGRRLDHIWITDNKKVKSINAKIIAETRSLHQPSDHVPLSYEFKLG